MVSQERREFNRREILTASIKLFALQGIAATTISQIAKAAHVVDRTVLNIFGSKDNLLLEVMTGLSGLLSGRLENLIASERYRTAVGLEQVMLLQRERAAILLQEPEMLLLLSEMKIWAARTHAENELVQRYTNDVHYMESIFCSALETGIRDGSIRGELNIPAALSILVTAYRAVLQQLAQNQIERETSTPVPVETELELYLKIHRLALSVQSRS